MTKMNLELNCVHGTPYPMELRGFKHFNDKVTQEFKNLYINYYCSDDLNIPNSFISAVTEFFNTLDQRTINADSDDFFNNFTYMSQDLIGRMQFDKAWQYWFQVLKIVGKYEADTGKHLHKGTPYYFSSVTALLKGDVDTGIIQMHLALEEDKKNNPGWFNAPAMNFVRLNSRNDNQYFKQFVEELYNFIDGFRCKYQTEILQVFSEQTFRDKFLDNAQLEEDIRYTFTYAIIKIWKYRQLRELEMADTLITPNIYGHSLLLILLVIDKLFKKTTKGKCFSDHLAYVNKREKWHELEGDYIEDLDVNQRCNTNFDLWLTSLLEHSYKTKSDRHVVSRLEECLILSYGIRNMQAHEISSKPIVWQKFTEVLEMILFSLFKAVSLQ